MTPVLENFLHSDGCREFSANEFLWFGGPRVPGRMSHDLLIHQTINSIDAFNDMRHLPVALQSLQGKHPDHSVTRDRDFAGPLPQAERLYGPFIDFLRRQ